MEKFLKVTKKVAIILLILLLAIIAFLGFYKKENNVWGNKVPEFNFGLDLNGARELRYKLDESEEEKNVYIDSEGNILGEVKEETSSTDEGVSLTDGETAETPATTEETSTTETEQNTDDSKPNYATEVRKIKANEDSVRTIDNFKKAKSIIQKRLEKEENFEYNIRLDNVTGEIILEIPDNENELSVANLAVTTIGKFEMIDEQTGIILMDKSDIKDVSSGIYNGDDGYQVYLTITFNKEGAEKLKNVSNKYRKVTNDAGEENTEYVSILVDGQKLTTTYFGEELSGGMIQLSMGKASKDQNEIKTTALESQRIADAIGNESMPIDYELTSDNFVKSIITSNEVKIAQIVFIVIIAIVSIIFIIKFKSKGLFASLLEVGFIAILVLTIRFLEINITINSIITFLGIVALNYIFMAEFILECNKNNSKKSAFWNTMKKYYLTIIPLIIITIVFTLNSSITISSIGMLLFWGILLQVLYNILTVFAFDFI